MGQGVTWLDGGGSGSGSGAMRLGFWPWQLPHLPDDRRRFDAEEPAEGEVGGEARGDDGDERLVVLEAVAVEHLASEERAADGVTKEGGEARAHAAHRQDERLRVTQTAPTRVFGSEPA